LEITARGIEEAFLALTGDDRADQAAPDRSAAGAAPDRRAARAGTIGGFR